MSDGSGGLSFPVGKGGQHIVCHASPDKRFIPESKLLFHSKSVSLTDYCNEMTSETFEKWFEEQWLLYICAKPVVVDSMSIH
jgi:hypothetical protein